MINPATPFKHHTTQAMNETPQTLYCHLLRSRWRRSSPAPPLLLCLSSLNLPFLSFHSAWFHPSSNTTHLTDCLFRGRGVPFLSEKKVQRTTGRESVQAGHETSSQPSRPPRPKPLNSQALQQAFSSAVNFCAGKD